MIKIQIYMGDIIVSQLHKKKLYSDSTVTKNGKKLNIKNEDYEYETHSFSIDKISINKRHLYKNGKYVYINSLATKKEELFVPYLMKNCTFKYSTRNYLKALEQFVVDVQRFLEQNSTTAQCKPYLHNEDYDTYTPKITHVKKSSKYERKPENF